MFREEEQYNNMKITEIEVGEIFVPLAKPFKTALRTVENVEDIVVRITTDTGAAGYGEAPPTAVITGDTKGSIRCAIEDFIRPRLAWHGDQRSGRHYVQAAFQHCEKHFRQGCGGYGSV